MIEFALSSYHVPEPIQNLIFDYYEKLCAKVRSKEWSTGFFLFDIGLFQGCVLSTILFDCVFNLLLDFLNPLKGYGYAYKGVQVSTMQNQAALSSHGHGQAGKCKLSAIVPTDGSSHPFSQNLSERGGTSWTASWSYVVRAGGPRFGGGLPQPSHASKCIVCLSRTFCNSPGCGTRCIVSYHTKNTSRLVYTPSEQAYPASAGS